ncbi:MAG TPA: carboxypeptidase regulatory-like domain-containing protein [Pyrinomonadaceae bacterium]|nr:carboxypeptidase regulatory-like domain-containing protein [Pyrinomonadaceae bacterium]
MKFHLRYVRAVLFAVALLGFASATRAQEITGVINGTVKDSNGAAVAGATVTLSDADKQVVVRTVTTNENGEYTAPNLLVGFYDIAVEAPNFKKALLSRVKLDVGSRRTADITLEAGNITESVLVESAPVAVELTTPTASTVINGDQVRQLSINNRNFVQLVTLAPGVTNDLDDLVFTGTNNPDTQVVNRTLISVNGARSTQNTFTVDGADVTDRGSNLTIQAYPSIDSIGEFKVLRSLYPAESGRSGGGQVNIVTRAGGDKFHGSAFEFIRNEAFNANDFASNRTPSLAASFGRDDNGKIKRKPFRYNNYGFTVGGPVYVPKFGEGSGGIGMRLQRTFFFFSEEQRRDTRYPTLSTRNASGAVPTALMKQGIFPIPICISASSATNCTSVLPAGTALSTLSPVSNVAQQYITQIWSHIPDPTAPATLQLDFPDINVAKFRQEIIRVDHTASDRLSFFYRFEHDKIPTEDADGTIGGRSNLPFVNRTVSDSPGKTHTANMIYTPNPRMIFEGRFTYGYGAIFINTVGLLAKSVSPIAANLPYESVRDTVPIVQVSGFNSLTGFGNYIDPSSKGNLAGNFTWIRGAHSLKFGVMGSRYTKTENALSGTNQGQFSTFSNTINSVTSPACVRATGVASNSINTLYQNWACFMMGKNVTFTQSKLDLTVDLRQKALEWFAQDEWRVRNNLTLSLGVRYSYFGPPSDNNGVLANFDPSLWRAADAPIVTGAGNRRAGSGNFCNGMIVNAQNVQTGPAAFNCRPTASPFGKYIYDADKLDFAPRIGIAWDPFRKGTTSVRLGYGIFHEQVSISAAELLALNPPFQETATQLITSMDQPIPGGAAIPVVASATPASIRAIQPNFLTPYMQHWSFDIQHQIGSKTIFTVGYYGSKGTHLNGNTEYNDLPVGFAINSQCATGTAALQDPGVVTQQCMTPGTALTATPTIFDQIRPFRGYRSINVLETRYNSNYHSLQAYLQYRLSGASQFNFAYTWSKNLTDNQTSSVSAAPQDVNNIRAEYSRAVLDRRHVVSANWIYELPFFAKSNGLVHTVLGGWQVSGIGTYYTGLPFTIASSTYDTAGIGFIPAIIAGGRPRLLCDPNENAPHTVDQWFNGACFAKQTPAGATGILNVPGDASRGAVDGPPTARVDFTLSKYFRFTESTSIQFRAEAFNVFNHTNFRNLSTSRAITNEALFGSVTSFRDPRVLQFGLKFLF